MSVISFNKHHQAKQRAQKRARQIMKDMQRDDCYVVVPANVDPYAGNFEEEVARVLYESELVRADK